MGKLPDWMEKKLLNPGEPSKLAKETAQRFIFGPWRKPPK
jgi:hypothetical protein